MGIQIFDNVEQALRSGYLIESPIADAEGFLHARIRLCAGWARALVRARPR